MACDAQIIVAGAGLANVNGTYLFAGNINSLGVSGPVYTKSGLLNTYPQVAYTNNGINFPTELRRYRYSIIDNILVFGTPSNQPIYQTNDYTAGNFPTCPTDLTYDVVLGPWGSISTPAPTVTNIPVITPTPVIITNAKTSNVRAFNARGRG